MLDFTSPWVTVILATISAFIAWITYRGTRNKMRLEYSIVASINLLPHGAPKALKIHLGERQIKSPHIVSIRIVNSGDKAIKAASFETDLSINMTGVREVVEVSATSSRPSDLGAEVAVEGERVKIKPLLWNSGDMLQLQILTDESPSSVVVMGRIEDVPKIHHRRELPYPPGSGNEGEMIAFDKFMWYFINPVSVAGLVGFIAFASFLAGRPYSTSQLVNCIILVVLSVVIYSIVVQKLVRRRRLWKV